MCVLEFRFAQIKFRKESGDETDISTKEKTENERTWFQKENGNKERKKRP